MSNNESLNQQHVLILIFKLLFVKTIQMSSLEHIHMSYVFYEHDSLCLMHIVNVQ